MYCKNCGNPVDPNAAVCVNCGCAKNVGSNFCSNCGKPVTPGSAVCMSCGYALTPAVNPDSKSKMAAGLLGIFLGAFGVHNFYLGNTGKAIAQLLITVLSCFALSMISGIWGLVEGILILTGSINTDGKGNPLKD